MWSHQIVVLVLERRRVAADLDAVALEILGQILGPEHRYIRLRCRSEIGQRVQYAVAALRNQRAAVQVHAANAFGSPVRIAAEQCVVLGCAKKADDTKLLHKLVPELLSPRFVEFAFLQVPLDVNIQKRRYPSNGHRRPIGLLDGPQVSEVSPLNCFLRICRRLADVVAIELCHRPQIVERAHLLGKLFADSNDFIRRPHVVDLRAFCALRLNQARGPIKRNAPIITYNATTAVSVGKPGDDA